MGVGLAPLREVSGVETDVSDAPDGFRDNFEPGGNGVVDPLEGVLVLANQSGNLVFGL